MPTEESASGAPSVTHGREGNNGSPGAVFQNSKVGMRPRGGNGQTVSPDGGALGSLAEIPGHIVEKHFGSGKDSAHRGVIVITGNNQKWSVLLA